MRYSSGIKMKKLQGTTGHPKGVLLTHHSLVNAAFIAARHKGLLEKVQLHFFFIPTWNFIEKITCLYILLISLFLGASYMLATSVFPLLRLSTWNSSGVIIGLPADIAKCQIQSESIS